MMNKFQIAVLGLIVLFVLAAVLYYVKPSLFNLIPMMSEESYENACAKDKDTTVPEASDGFSGSPKPLMSDEEDPTRLNAEPKDCFPQEHLDPKDLLPNDTTTKWAQTNPSGQGNIGEQNFLDAGYHIGINTVGQSMRNANLQFRSEPPNPQTRVSPWLQSTIDPDLGRKPLE